MIRDDANHVMYKKKKKITKFGKYNIPNEFIITKITKMSRFQKKKYVYTISNNVILSLLMIES